LGTINDYSYSTINGIEYSDVLQEIKLDESLPTGEANMFKALIGKFSSIFAKSDIPSAIDRTLGEHEIVLKPGTKSLSQNPRRMSPSQRAIISTHINNMLKDGIIQPSSSSWASPIVLAPKKNGETRFCVDYRQLNTATIRDVYPLPNIEDIIDTLAGAKYLSTLDLASGYHQIMMSAESAPLTAFTSHEGLFEYKRMPFGLTNAPATFQRVMDSTLAGLKWKCCLVYLDDIVVFSKTFEDHIRDLESIFGRLKKAKLSLKAKKCHLCCKEITYLGHLITRDGIREDPEKVATIAHFQPPKDKKSLLSFLGLTGHFHKFIKDYHIVVEPLRQLIRDDVKWEWTHERATAFNEIKTLLTKKGGPILTLPDMTGRYPFSLHCDASDNGLGAVLYQQQPDGSEKVIQYASRTLSDGERKWHTTEKEALAIIWACEKFAPYLIGPKFKVISDHASLQWLWNYKKGRLARWALRASEFDFDIIHKPGKENVVPDHASRYPIASSESVTESKDEEDEGRLENALVAMIATRDNSLLVGLNIGSIPHATISNIERVDHPPIAWDVSEWRQRIYSSYSSSSCKVTDIYKRLLRGNKTKGDVNYQIDNFGLLRRKILLPTGPTKSMVLQTQLVLPTSIRDEFLEMFHKNILSGHFGRNKMYSKMLPLIWWPGMYRDIRKYVAQCIPCQRHKGSILKNRPLFSTMPNHTWETACIDLVGPLPLSDKGNKYICVITDPFTKWAEAIALPNKSDQAVSEAIFNGLICRHSVPKYIRTDQGTEFTNNLMLRLMDRMNIRHKKTCPYYPQANGHVERFNRTLVESLAKNCEFEPSKWEHFLEGTLFAYRTSTHAVLNCSPFEMLYGRQPTLPIHILNSTNADLATDVIQYGTRLTYNLVHMSKVVKRMLKDTAQARNKEWLQTAKPLTLRVGDWILLRDRKIKLRKLVQTTSSHTGHTSKADSAKFQSEWLGPYKVIKVLPNAVTIDDTDRNEHRSVSLANVKFFHTRSSTEENQPLTWEPVIRDAIDVHSDTADIDPNLTEQDPLKWYVIERIIDFRRSKKGHEYLIKWEGYDSSHNSWTKSSNIEGQGALNDFWSEHASHYPVLTIPIKYRAYFPKEGRVSVTHKRSSSSTNRHLKRKRY
jgi:hypothetical protein